MRLYYGCHSKHDARRVLIRIGKQGLVCLGDRASQLRTAVRRPRLTVTHTPAVVESKLRFDRAEPSRSCSADTAAATLLRW